MDERTERLGYIPQKELVYNKLLHYTDFLDEESQTYLASIKTNLGKSILHQNLSDISFWTSQLAVYIRLYGRKFSKEDHINFIKVLFELLVAPGIELSFVNKVAIMLNTLLKKVELISRDDLILPWRPLYELYDRTFFSPYESLGMLLIPCNLESHLKALIRACRPYFSLESTQEILDEFRPFMCPFDSEMAKAMNYFELFLCTTLPPSEHHRGFKLWFDEFMEIWQNWHSVPTWENMKTDQDTQLIDDELEFSSEVLRLSQRAILWLFSRVAKDNIGYINWDPYIPTIFTRLLRSFNLPGRSNQVQVYRYGSSFHTTAIVNLIASMLGGGSSCQIYIGRLFKTLESFFHPSNLGRWLPKLQKFLQKLPLAVIKRLHR
ncbi:Proteasome activator complex subunit 4, partial [Stegodyphus mimosarum]